MVISVPPPVRLENRLDVVVRRRIGQVHALDMHDSPERLERHVLARQIEIATFAIAPLAAELAAGLGLADAHRHGPARRAQQPFLHDLGLDVRAIDRLGRRLEPPCDDDVAISIRPE
jgi:hypothetical protein